jgi:mannose/fructose/N-acetylgalactosamine-specific phosphotransferase system component IIC
MRRNISIITLLIIGIGVGLLLKNVKTGMVIGLAIGLLMSAIGTKSK